MSDTQTRVARSVRKSIMAVAGFKYLSQLLEGGASDESAKPMFKWLLTGEYTENILTTGQCSSNGDYDNDAERPAITYGIILAVIHHADPQVKESISEVIRKIVSTPEILGKIKKTDIPELPMCSWLARFLTFSQSSLPDGYLQDFILNPDAIEGVVSQSLELMNAFRSIDR